MSPSPSIIPTTRKRRCDLDTHLRLPPAARVLGPAGHFRREALAALLRPGNAGSNTAADHAVVLTEAMAALPATYRPTRWVPAGRTCLPVRRRRIFWCAPIPPRYPRLRQDLPSRRCRVFVRLHGHRTSERGGHRAGRGGGARLLQRDECVGRNDQHRGADYPGLPGRGPLDPLSSAPPELHHLVTVQSPAHQSASGSGGIRRSVGSASYGSPR